MVLIQVQRVVEDHKKMTKSTQHVIEGRKLHAMNSKPDHSFHDWWILGRKLNRSIISNDVDITLLASLHQQIEQQGIWVTPFIASTLSTDIHADILLGYILELCVKRLSEVQHKVELGQAIGDLARYLCILQLFFPALVKQKYPTCNRG